MRRNGTKIVGVGIALAILALSLSPAAKATDRNFTLYMSTASGWGATPTQMSNPGPSLTVDQGDNVTLVLNSTDGNNHNWYIDYNNDLTDDQTEPNSPNFKNSEIVWHFVADRNGTFTYRSKFDAAVAGTIVMNAPGGTNPPPGGSVGYLLAAGLALVIILAVVFVLLFFLERRGFLVRRPPPANAKPPRKA